MGLARNWTAEEDEYLQENWGNISVPTLCEKLNRSKNAIVIRVHRLGLPPFLEAGGYISFNQLMIAVTGSNSGGDYKQRSWGENRGLPIHKKRNNKCSFRVVYLHEFWKWAEENRSFIDFSKMEPLALGEEPAWVAEQRKKDFGACAIQSKVPWTRLDDQKLINLLRQHRYGYSEISKELRRSAGAIQLRCLDLGLRERPVRADNHKPWTEEEFCTLAEGIRTGSAYSEISRLVGRSERAVRGRIYSTYRTEVADKVRALMGNGAWGAGAPELRVWEARRRPEVKQNIEGLAALLWARRNTLCTEPCRRETFLERERSNAEDYF